MEEKINVAELLKNCPHGMELDCTMFEGVTFNGVYEQHTSYPIKINLKNGETRLLTAYGCFNHDESAKCVIFPKGKTTWEGFQRPFKDGDILATDLGSVFYLNTRLNTDERYGCYVGIGGDGSFHICVPFAYKECCGFALEDEKQKLFKTIKDNGYKWNSNTKTLEKLIVPKFKVGDNIRIKGTSAIYVVTEIREDCYMLDDKDISLLFKKQDEWELAPNKFDITTLKPFESRVLVRNSFSGFWMPTFWGVYETEKSNEHQYRNYLTTKGFFRHCIPYNDDTKHLVGKTDDCDEYYKTWE